MLNKNIQKIKLRKNKRVKDEKKAADRERTLPRNRQLYKYKLIVQQQNRFNFNLVVYKALTRLFKL